ncbi:hypothetical protein BH10PSE6_BH10PSE6_07540 [soil metagenome]
MDPARSRAGSTFIESRSGRHRPLRPQPSSEPIRDPAADHLLTPQNSVFIIIDYQPVQVTSIASMDRQLLVNNIVGCAKAAVAFGLPVIHSTVNVETGLNKPPVRRPARRLRAINGPFGRKRAHEPSDYLVSNRNS